MVSTKTNDVDYAYLIFALGRLANNDLGNAFANVQRVAQGTPESVQKYLYRTVAYIGGTTVMKTTLTVKSFNILTQVMAIR